MLVQKAVINFCILITLGIVGAEHKTLELLGGEIEEYLKIRVFPQLGADGYYEVKLILPNGKEEPLNPARLKNEISTEQRFAIRKIDLARLGPGTHQVKVSVAEMMIGKPVHGPHTADIDVAKMGWHKFWPRKYDPKDTTEFYNPNLPEGMNNDPETTGGRMKLKGKEAKEMTESLYTNVNTKQEHESELSISERQYNIDKAKREGMDRLRSLRDETKAQTGKDTDEHLGHDDQHTSQHDQQGHAEPKRSQSPPQPSNIPPKPLEKQAQHSIAQKKVQEVPPVAAQNRASRKPRPIQNAKEVPWQNRNFKGASMDDLLKKDSDARLVKVLV